MTARSDPKAEAMRRVYALILAWPKPGEENKSADEETVYEAPSSPAEEPSDLDNRGVAN